jgi:hypothetical protein
MTFEISEARPLLAIDEIENSRLRVMYQNDSLALSHLLPTAGSHQKSQSLRKWIVSRLLEFAPRGTKRRENLRRFWKYVPNTYKLTFLEMNNGRSNLKHRFALSAAFNLDRGFGIRTSDSPKVSVVIPVHNKYQLTLQCLRSLQLNTDSTPFEIIVVNDASNDWTALSLKNIRGIKVIGVQNNLGYLRATNLGISLALGSYFALLNN